MFGDSAFEEEEDLDPSEENRIHRLDAEMEEDEPVAYGGLDERLRRRDAIAQLLREVGGC